mmetsp:Transcript_50579/g.118121  ORF Transcript_50579/g.118121 Transcript_50579/m.118121 type:complete len:1327 (-) Transcript_50579:99-4079(-)
MPPSSRGLVGEDAWKVGAARSPRTSDATDVQEQLQLLQDEVRRSRRHTTFAYTVAAIALLIGFLCCLLSQHREGGDSYTVGSSTDDAYRIASSQVDVLRNLAEATETVSEDNATHSSDEHGHAHDALIYLFNAIIIGTLVLHLTTIPMLENMQTTVVLFILGMFSAFLHNWLDLEEHWGVIGRSHKMWMDIDPHLILFTLLPGLLGGDALCTDTSVAKRVASQCMYLAGPGVVVSALLTALFLSWQLGWSRDLSLTMGAILAATDPVAVVGLLKQLGAPPTLTIQIAGESLLNDGTAIVLFSLAYDMLQGETFTVSQMVIFMVRKALFACILGWAIGWLFALWINAASDRFEHHASTIQISLTICCAYWSFIVAEGILDMSGVLCTVVACLVLADSIWMLVLDKESMHHVWHMLEFLGNTIIFFLAGALTGDSMATIPWEDYLNLIAIYVVTTLIRGMIVFGSRPILKYLSANSQPVSRAEAFLMTWGGLRGAVGLALAIQVRSEKAGGAISELEARRVLFYTGGIATLTMVINATTCPKLVRALGIVQGHGAQRTMLLSLHEQMVCLASEEGSSNFVVNKLITDILKGIEKRIHGIDAHSIGNGDKSDSDDENYESEVSKGSKGNGANRLSVEICKDPTDSAETDVRRSHLSAKERGSVNAGTETSVRSMSSIGAFLMSRQDSAHSVGIVNWLAMKHAPTVAGNIVATEYEVTEGWRVMVPKDRLRLLELPNIPHIGGKEQAEMMRLVTDNTAAPGKVQMVNQAFLALLRAQYWSQINAGKFVAGSGPPEMLLSSIVYAEQHAEEGLKDLDYILEELGLEFRAPDHDTFNEEKDPRRLSRGSSRLSRPSRTGGSPKDRKRRPSMRSVEDVRQAVTMSKLVVAQGDGGALASGFVGPVVRHPIFKFLIHLSIVLNLVVLFAQEEKRHAEGETGLEWRICEAALTILFLLEFLLKLCAYRGKHMRDPWNVVDGLLALTRTTFLALEIIGSALDMELGPNYSSEISLVRLYRTFQVLKETRVFRLQKLFYLLRNRFVHNKEVSVDNVRNYRPLIVLSALVCAHVKSQELFESYFGDVESRSHSNEQARVILQSRTTVNKALVLIGTAVMKVEKALLKRLTVLREGSKLTAKISQLVLDAEHVGAVSGREAEWILEPLKDKTKMWRDLMQQAEMGIVLDAGEGSVEWHVQRARTIGEITMPSMSTLEAAAMDDGEGSPTQSLSSPKSSIAKGAKEFDDMCVTTHDPTLEAQDSLMSPVTRVDSSGATAAFPTDREEDVFTSVPSLNRGLMVSGLSSPRVHTLPFCPDMPIGDPPTMMTAVTSIDRERSG